MKRKTITSLLILCALIFIAPLVKNKTVTLSMCKITGSTKYISDYYFFKSVDIKESALETWLKTNLDKDFKPKYHVYGVHNVYLFGGDSRSCGTPPQIFSIRPLMREIVANNSDDQLEALVKTIESGTEHQVEDAFIKIENQIFL